MEEDGYIEVNSKRVVSPDTQINDFNRENFSEALKQHHDIEAITTVAMRNFQCSNNNFTELMNAISDNVQDESPLTEFKLECPPALTEARFANLAAKCQNLQKLSFFYTDRLSNEAINGMIVFIEDVMRQKPTLESIALNNISTNAAHAQRPLNAIIGNKQLNTSLETLDLVGNSTWWCSEHQGKANFAILVRMLAQLSSLK